LLYPAESGIGKAVARISGRLRHRLFMAGLALSSALAACSAPALAPRPPAAAAPAPSAASEPPAPAAPAAASVPDARILTGMALAEVVALLGEPDFRRSEPPAELWQYRSADCVLDLFFYADAGGYRVRRSATRDRHVAPPMVASCTAAFDRQSRQSGL
jgi:hypothetical protein